MCGGIFNGRCIRCIENFLESVKALLKSISIWWYGQEYGISFFSDSRCSTWWRSSRHIWGRTFITCS